MIIQITRLRYEFNNHITSNCGDMIVNMFALNWYFKNTCIYMYNINNMKPFYLFLLKFSKISFHLLEANEAKFSNLPKISEICYIKIKAGKKKNYL